MAGPFTPLLVAGGVLKAGAQFRSGRKRGEAFDDLADQIMQAGLEAARDFERESSSTLSSGVARRAASGVQINTGTALMVNEQSIKEIAKGRQRILEEARRRARAAEKQAESSRFGGALGGASTLLTTATSAFS